MAVAHLVRASIIVGEITITAEVLSELVEIAGVAADTAGAVHFPIPVDVNLTLQEGSLKVITAAIGALFSVYYFVGNYKAFKEGVVDICHDANDFGHDF